MESTAKFLSPIKQKRREKVKVKHSQTSPKYIATFYTITTHSNAIAQE